MSASSFNRVVLMGNLTRDPELRFTQSNLAVCKVGLALNRKVKDQRTEQWRDEATFVDVTIFGKRAEAFHKFHTKGSSAFFEGELRLDSWTDKETGQKRSRLHVVANTWEFVGGRPQNDSGGGSRGWQPHESPYPSQQTQHTQPAAQGDWLGGDDIPF